MDDKEPLKFWEVLAGFPLYVLRLFANPPSLLGRNDGDKTPSLHQQMLYTLFGLAIIVLAFSDNRVLSGEERPLLSTFKGVMMRAHLRSWDWLEPVYAPFQLGQGEAMRLWDTLLTTGFLCYAMLAALIGVAVVARLRMRVFKLSWESSLSTGLNGFMACTALVALSLVPLTELLICRDCLVRGTLFVLMNLAGWVYFGYYTLSDYGERKRGLWRMLGASFVHGTVLYFAAYFVFFILIVAIIPM